MRSKGSAITPSDATTNHQLTFLKPASPALLAYAASVDDGTSPSNAMTRLLIPMTRPVFEGGPSCKMWKYMAHCVVRIHPKRRTDASRAACEEAALISRYSADKVLTPKKISEVFRCANNKEDERPPRAPPNGTATSKIH